MLFATDLALDAAFFAAGFFAAAEVFAVVAVFVVLPAAVFRVADLVVEVGLLCAAAEPEAAALAGARLRVGFAASAPAVSLAGFAGALRARVFGALVGFVSLDFAKISLPGKRCSNFNVHVNAKMQAQIYLQPAPEGVIAPAFMPLPYVANPLCSKGFLHDPVH